MEHSELEVACRTFVGAAFGVLSKEHVLPVPIFHRYISVGRDYFGGSIMELPEYSDFESQLEAAYPGRFTEAEARTHTEFPATYIFNFLEACVVRSAGDASYELALKDSIKELHDVLESEEYELAACRFVTHLTTLTRHEVHVGGITVVPEPEGFGGLTRRIAKEISGAPPAWNREDPRLFDPPHSLLVVRQTSREEDVDAARAALSTRLERFLLIARLLTAGTVQSAYEITGSTTLIGRLSPNLRTYQKASLDALVRRTVYIAGTESPAFERLGSLIDEVEIRRTDMVATSFDVALRKFNRSYASNSPFELLVDLASSLEAALIGGEKETEGLTLRLRNRTAALLATARDSAEALFSDVGLLYGLRSKLVHGGALSQKELTKVIRRISTVPGDAAERRFGAAVAFAVDRMRDLTRRAILARLCLSSKPDPLWPFDQDVLVDQALASDTTRAIWRRRWLERLDEIGVGDAADQPRPAVDFWSPDDR